MGLKKKFVKMFDLLCNFMAMKQIVVKLHILTTRGQCGAVTQTDH